jgi:hypothetical protein
VELVSDPDYINQYIVSYHNDIVAEEEIATGIVMNNSEPSFFAVEKPIATPKKGLYR